jgi:hypothetical protein
MRNICSFDGVTIKEKVKIPPPDGKDVIELPAPLCDSGLWEVKLTKYKQHKQYVTVKYIWCCLGHPSNKSKNIKFKTPRFQRGG